MTIELAVESMQGGLACGETGVDAVVSCYGEGF